MESPFKGKTGLRRILNATRYSFAGLAAAVRHEEAFRQELVFAVVLIPCGWFLGANGTQRAILIGSVLLVLIVELIIPPKAAVDRVSLDQSGGPKDINQRQCCQS
jgi:diacylglycerol kinase (ATP)